MLVLEQGGEAMREPPRSRSETRRPTAAALGLVAAVLLASAGPATAGDPIYRFVDSEGRVHFTDAPVHARYEPVRLERRVVVTGATERPAARLRDGRRFDGVVQLVARREGVAASLLKAVIAAESNFDPWAVSPKGAQGLMQLMPATSRALGVKNPFHQHENVTAGARYLRGLLARYGGELALALAAYNAGPTAVDRYGGVPPYPETQQYVRKVLAYHQRYDGDFSR